MADVTMPRLSDTMAEGTIAAWLKQPGEVVAKGEVIAQIETDKATMDLTVFEAGTLQEILAPEGTTVAIGAPVARIGTGAPTAPAKGSAPAAPAKSEGGPAAGAARATPAESEAAPADAHTSPTPEDEGAARAHAPEATPSDQAGTAIVDASAALPSDMRAAPAPQGEGAAPDADVSATPARNGAPEGQPPADTHAASAPAPQAPAALRASPMARHIAAEHGLDLTQVTGSGPQGRVIRADVEAALAAGPPSATADSQPPGQEPVLSGAQLDPSIGEPGEDQQVPLTQMRRTIARRMADSTRTIPHFFLTTTVDATDLVALRTQILDQAPDDAPKVSFNDLVVRAAALALRQVPTVNVSFAEDHLVQHAHVNIGIAVATDRGLIVPVVRDVDRKSVTTIARETRDLAMRAQAGKLQPTDYSGGTFTISNLGMFGVEQFNAVINPPEAAILAVGAIVSEPAAHEGAIVLRDRLKLTLSVDHRALDGAGGARYLQALRALLERPLRLLV
jgi:pyruvate dehydrogenase E2 component (dihydrolipoamide acetyltransferase)